MAQQLGSFEKVLRFGEGRRVKRLAEQAAYIGTLEPEFEALSDEELAGKTVEFKQRIENGEPVDELVFEAFAAVREAFKRTMGIRLFDVQQMGGIVLHEGDIAEMKTGEGKTFVAVQPLYLNALTGNSVHLVTVNDYLAKRDPEWTKPVWDALGMRASLIAEHDALRRPARGLRGRRRLRHELRVRLRLPARQHGRHARGRRPARPRLRDRGRGRLDPDRRGAHAADHLRRARDRRPGLLRLRARRARRSRASRPKPGQPKGAAEASGADFEYDEKHKTVSPMQGAIEAVERALGIDNLYDPRNGAARQPPQPGAEGARRSSTATSTTSSRTARSRSSTSSPAGSWKAAAGRRACTRRSRRRRACRIQEEHQTLATITLQNYFRLYEKLAGMTGTAKTEEKEFVEIYDLHVVEIPTNVQVARNDENDLIFKTGEAKYNAAIADIKERHEKGQPVLVGTISVEVSEHLSQLLDRQGIPHNVLNAKQHEKEAGIIAEAGQRGAVTIATNMAGRGVDIKLDDGSQGARRPVRARHRAPRGAPDRQPAPRPLGPPGRPRRVALLPLRPGRPRAPVRRRPDLQHHGALQGAGRPAHGGEDPLEPDRERAEEGRGAELRHAQERPQVRRRHEQAAHGDLRAAPARARGRGPLRGGRALDRRGDRAHVDQYTTGEFDEEWDLDALCQAMVDLYATDDRSRRTSCARRSGSTARRSSRSSRRTRATRTRRRSRASG